MTLKCQHIKSRALGLKILVLSECHLPINPTEQEMRNCYRPVQQRCHDEQEEGLWSGIFYLQIEDHHEY